MAQPYLDLKHIMSIQMGNPNFELHKLEKQYRDLYNKASIAYYTVNAADRRILNCNKAAQKLLDHSKKVMLQMKIFELYADTPHGILTRRIKFSKILKPVNLSATLSYRQNSTADTPSG